MRKLHEVTYDYVSHMAHYSSYDNEAFYKRQRELEMEMAEVYCDIIGRRLNFTASPDYINDRAQLLYGNLELINSYYGGENEWRLQTEDDIKYTANCLHEYFYTLTAIEYFRHNRTSPFAECHFDLTPIMKNKDY